MRAILVAMQLELRSWLSWVWMILVVFGRRAIRAPEPSGSSTTSEGDQNKARPALTLNC